MTEILAMGKMIILRIISFTLYALSIFIILLSIKGVIDGLSEASLYITPGMKKDVIVGTILGYMTAPALGLLLSGGFITLGRACSRLRKKINSEYL